MHTPFLLSKLALDDMIPRGSVVKIGSGAAVGPGRGPYPDAREVGAVAYGTTKAALERFTQGFAVEVYRYGASVTCLSPSQIVPSWANVREGLVDSIDDPRGEWPNVMAQAALLLASEPLDKVTGRVCYSQQILKEFWLGDRGQRYGCRRRSSRLGVQSDLNSILERGILRAIAGPVVTEGITGYSECNDGRSPPWRRR